MAKKIKLSPVEKEEKEYRAALRDYRAALKAYMRACGITDESNVKENFGTIYQGRYGSWLRFAKDYVAYTYDTQGWRDYFDYGKFENDFRKVCEVEETTGGVIIRDLEYDEGLNPIYAKSFSDYARKVARETIIDTAHFPRWEPYCDYDAVIEKLKTRYISLPARSGIFIFLDI